MARAELLGNRAVILAALIYVLDFQRNRRARRHPLEHAGEDTHLVRLLPLRGELRLTGTALVEPGLQIRLGERNPRRAAIDDAANGRPVAFAPGGDAEQMPERIMRH